MKGYRAGLVLEIVGVSYAQLDYWAKIGFIKPSIKSSGKESRRLYSFTDLVRLNAAKSLLDSGVSLQKIRKSVDYLKQHEPEIKEPLSELKLLTNGKSIFALTNDSKKVMDVLNKRQLVWSIAIDKISQKTKDEIKKIGKSKREEDSPDRKEHT